MLSKNSEILFKERYQREGETSEGVVKRVSDFLSNGDEHLKDKLHNYIINGIFIPNSPALMNAGVPGGSLHACYTLPIDDNIESIFNAVTNMAKIFQTGGGVGINFSKLRPQGAPLSRGGTSSGSVSFMGIFDKVVDTVKQGGRRRGALMGILNCDHPDIYRFISSKLTGNLQNFNISVMANNEFMERALSSPTSIDANILDLVSFASWVNGDPAFLFYDRINQDTHGIKVDTTNPCSEVALPHYLACCLGSVNLSKMVRNGEFLFEKFYDTCIMGMQVLFNMNQLSTYPIQETAKLMAVYNPVGLGIMGFADCLIKLGIFYDSQECLDFIDKIGAIYKESSEEFSRDTYAFYRRAIAPTGSLSIIADCSSGIEPVYDVAFSRSLTIGKIEEVKNIYKSKYVRTAHQVSPEWHVKVAGQWQKWVDGGVSKTVNMPYHASVHDIKCIYKLAWEIGMKGVTIYRDGSRSNQVLESNREALEAFNGKCSDSSCVL